MASSSWNHEWIYDVFINFRGKDTRDSFVYHLHAAISNAGINAFLDNKSLEKGDELKSVLLRAIEGSRISLVVLSPHYTSSSWCLDELAKIMECRRTYGQMVIPIFYHVDPSDVRYQKGSFSLDAIERRGYTSEAVERWRTALKEVAGFSGYNLSTDRSEAVTINEIVKNIFAKIDVTHVRVKSITEFPVGLVSRLQEVIKLIESQSIKVCMVGIWGMGGLGKTTTAKAIYNQIHRKFMCTSFIENITEVCENGSRGHMHLQEQLLSDVLEIKEIHSIGETTMIKKILSGKRALLVLDDVTTIEQFRALCGNRLWFGSGSVIIVTTRDVQLLNSLKADYVYKMVEMDEDESLELFSWHAFGEASPKEDFSELSRSVVAYCGGLPLALEVLGSYLTDREEKEWKNVLSKLERIPNDQVQQKLRISYDGLKDELEKDIFLDICCFFIGEDRVYVTDILNGRGLYADIVITLLIERSLLQVERNNKLGMHDLVRDMGREIVRETSKKEPGKCSRLWFHEDVQDVLYQNTGAETVEGLVLKMQREDRCCFNANAFKEMKKLRLLQLDNVELSGDYGHLSKELTWVCWTGCAFKHIPSDFYQGNLIVMDLRYSNIIQVWKEDKLLENLQILNLSHSRYLKKTPDFSRLPNLQKLTMEDCPSLRKIHQSIGELSNIVLINLKDCTSLGNLPRKIYELKSVETLLLSGCSKIDKLEEDIVQMESLTTLIAKDTAIEEVPFSIIRMKSIAYISLCGYEGFTSDVFPSLILSWMSPSTTMNYQFHISPSRGMSLSPVSMDIQNNNSGDISPLLPRFLNPRCVTIQCGSGIQLTQELRRFLDEQYDVSFAESITTSHTSQISNFSLRSFFIGMGSCHLVIDSLGQRIAQGLASSDSYNIFLPGDNYPSWEAFTGEGSSVHFGVPDHDSDCSMKGILLCVVYSSTLENIATESLISVLIINYTKFTIQIFKRDTVMSFNDENWQCVISNIGSGDDVEIFAAFCHGLTVKVTAVYLIYGESNAIEIVPSIKVKIEPSPQVNVVSLPNVEMEPLSEVKMQSLAEVEVELSPEVSVQESANVEMEPSPEVNVQPLPNGEMEPSPEVNLQPLPQVGMQSSPEVNVHPSANVEMEPSPEVNLQPSTNVEMESSPKANKNIFTRLAKRMGECLCLSQKRGFNNF